MTRSRWLAAIALAAVALFALSFVNAWIVHDRELRGEGYRFVQYFLSAWRGVGMPVLTVAAVTALATAGWATAVLRRPSLAAWPLMAGSVVVLGLMVATAWPLAQDDHGEERRHSGQCADDYARISRRQMGQACYQ